MQLEEILSELEHNTTELPRLALERAIAEREAITPILISTLDKLSNNLEELLEKEDYDLHLYALYLLAQFREVSAYPVIIKFFSVPGEIALDITGDIVTEDLGRILASVCGGDIEPIKQLIENTEVNEYVRVAGLDSLLVLLAQGIISREQIIQYYAKLFSTFSREESDYIWTELVITSAQICAIELKEEIDRVFAEDLIDLFFVSKKNIDDDLEVGIEAALRKLRENPRYSFIENTILEMENWSCFQPEQAFRPNNRLIVPEGFSLTASKKSKNKAKKKKKMQEQSRKKNRSKKK